jgi:glucan biosynthesis protein C
MRSRVSDRLYAIDWLRVFVMGVVYLFHVLRIFDVDPGSSLKNAQTSVLASVYTFFVTQWQMPVFFLVAGVSTWFSLQSRTLRHYLRERVNRLVLPLVFGSLTLAPWCAYLSGLNHNTFQGSWLAYLPLHFARVRQIIQATPEYRHSMARLFAVSWHLWFLGHLFVFSVVALPLFGRAAAGPRNHLVHSPAVLSTSRWGLALLGAPIVALRMALNARFPAYLDWSDTLVWFTVFLLGWLFVADPRFLSAVRAQAGAWLGVGLVAFGLLLAAYAGGYLIHWLDRPAYTWDYLLFQLLSGIHTWAWLLAITGMALRRFDFTNRSLEYAGEAVLPFYILHFPVILTIGAWIVPWQTAISVKFLAIATSSFVVTIAIYELAVRRSPLLRSLFGMKPLRAVSPKVSHPLPNQLQRSEDAHAEDVV